jgi:hypothetical protein
MLEEGVSDHCHERMTMKTLPGPSLEVVEAEFLIADGPACRSLAPQVSLSR